MTIPQDHSDVRSIRIAYALNAILGRRQEQLAAALGVSFSTVNAWINGKRKPHESHAAGLDGLFQEAVSSQPDSSEAKLRIVTALLHVRYGSPHLGNQRDPLDELFFILLSLKTSHRTYEETFEHFKKQFHPWRRLLDADADEVQAHIRRGGLGTIKAKAFIDIAARLKSDFGVVSLNRIRSWDAARAGSYLMSLPGVGIKTARCVMMYSLGLDVMPVDTHTYRVGVRLGLIETAKNPNAAHGAFDKALAPKLAYPLHTNLVAHGREVCVDPTPRCSACELARLCNYKNARVADSEAAASPKIRSSGEKLLGAQMLRDGRPRAVDIYAGCGGLSLGLDMAGFDVSFALDWDAHACATHEKNFPGATVVCKDVVQVTGQEIQRASGGEIALVAGGPNCPGVSERGLRSPDDPRNFMLPEFVRLVEELQPRAFLMENVPGLGHRQNFAMLKGIFETFERLGYDCAGDVLLAADYGVPQLRYRFFLVGIRGGIRPSFPLPTHASEEARASGQRLPYITVRDAIFDLPSIPASHQVNQRLAYVCEADSPYRALMRAGSDGIWNHVCSATEEINLLRANEIKEGGNWKDIPTNLLPDRFFACRMTDHSTTYARLRRDQPAFTVTSLFGNITAGAFTHPRDTRALSIREGARLQSFPDSFHFHGPRNSQYRQIGNAVPPLLAASVARHLLQLLKGKQPDSRSPRITPELLRDPRGSDALPVLTPRFKQLFGQATRWPVGWGTPPANPSERLTSNYMLKPEFWPTHLLKTRRNTLDAGVMRSERKAA